MNEKDLKKMEKELQAKADGLAKWEKELGEKEKDLEERKTLVVSEEKRNQDLIYFRRRPRRLVDAERRFRYWTGYYGKTEKIWSR